MGKKSKKKASCAKRRSTPPPPSATLKFKQGDRVTLKGLKTNIQYNGKNGKVDSLPKNQGAHIESDDERYGILLDGKKNPIAVCQRNIESEKPNQKDFKTTEQLREERAEKLVGFQRPDENEFMNADQLSMMRMFADMFMTEDHQIKMYGRKIEPLPNFYKELREQGEFPLGVNPQWGNSYLRTAYEQSYNLPHVMELGMKQPDYSPSVGDILKRLGTNHPHKLGWYKSNPGPASIYPNINNSYTKLVNRSYSNQPYRKEVLTRGTTHIAVGFVDLGILFAATLAPNPETRKQGPLQFLGIEMSSYAVAKTAVIWEMLKQTPPKSSSKRDDHLRSIVQAWFSTTWTKGTDAAVKLALSALCGHRSSNDNDDSVLNPDVCKILDHWLTASSTPLKMARREREKSLTDAYSSTATLERKCDRLAMARYELTGDFAVLDKPQMGNMLMFDCPEGTAPLDINETVFSALDWKETVPLLPNNNVIAAAEAFALNGIAKLADWATNGHVTVELVCSRVEDMIPEIVGHKAWTMSWSNIMDYTELPAFHAMARECSAHGDTIHFGYSMNWVLNVYGAIIFDFPDAEGRGTIIDLANKNVEDAYKSMKWDRYLRLPPPVNPINTTSNWALEYMYWREWARHFVETGSRSGPCMMMNQEHVFSVPLSNTGDSTIALTWTYDKDIKPNAISAPEPSFNIPNMSR